LFALSGRGKFEVTIFVVVQIVLTHTVIAPAIFVGRREINLAQGVARFVEQSEVGFACKSNTWQQHGGQDGDREGRFKNRHNFSLWLKDMTARWRVSTNELHLLKVNLRFFNLIKLNLNKYK
jgi:hypothetical protein